MNLSVNVQGSSGCQFFGGEVLGSCLRLTERKIGLQEVFRVAAPGLTKFRLPHLEIARLLMGCPEISSFIKNANHSVM
jgi:hypothetical protein